jgi:nicotinamidase-related amidase/uncharacterized damage-inducible protein DinB
MLPTLLAHKNAEDQALFSQLAALDPQAHGDLLHAARRTLQHIHVVDQIFQAHLSGQAHSHTATNTVHTPELGELKASMAKLDAGLLHFTETANEQALAEQIDFVFTDGDAGRMSRQEMLMHLITHGAYHRGQVGQMLKAAGMAPPRDLLTRFLHATEPQRRLPANPQPEREALLVIDVQQGLCVGEHAPWEVQGLLARINALSAGARAAGCPVIWVQHQDALLVPDSAAWQLPAALHTASSDLRIRKTTPDAFLRTPLWDLMQQLGVTRLVVCGMHTEFCVDTTVRRALALGCPVTLVADAHTSCGSKGGSAEQVIAHHNDTLSHISSFGPRVSLVTTAEMVWPQARV